VNPEQLLKLVLDYTNTNDYDDEADGWLSTRLDGKVLTVEFMQDSDEGKQAWSASWELAEAARPEPAP
jgi:hypothetical protein